MSNPGQPKVNNLSATAAIAVSMNVLVQTIKKQRFVITVLACLLVISVVVNAMLFNHKEEPIPLGITPDLKVIPLKKLDENVFEPGRVIAWAEDKNDFPNGLSEFMTAKAKDNWLLSIKSAGYKDYVEQNGMTAYAVKTAKAIVTRNGFDKSVGMNVWVIELPLLVTFDSGSQSGKGTKNMKVVLRVFVGEFGFERAKEGLLIGRVELLQGS
jgi:hypothetical protein